MNWIVLLLALIQIESGGVASVGDKHLKNHAYGVLQIRQPCLNDVNRIYHTSLTLEQIHQSESLSRWCVVAYLKHYGARYTEITGLPFTPEIAARIHNGGPNGWRKDSTLEYEQKFKKAYNELNQ